MAAIGPNIKPTKVEHPNAYKAEIKATSLIPGGYGHHTRYPNSNYYVQNLNWKQSSRSHEAADPAIAERNAAMYARFVNRTDRKRNEIVIKTKVDKKMLEYDTAIDERRERLQKLLHKEEQVYIRETVDAAQRGTQDILKNTLEQLEAVRKKKGAEAKAFIEEKRIKQYKNRCDEVTTMNVKKNLLETKIVNLQQMREKQSRKEKEKEADRLWYEMMKKDMEALKEREEQDLLEMKKRQKECMEVLRIQIQAEKKLREEEIQSGIEARLEIQKEMEREQREELENINGEIQRKEKFTKEIRKQFLQNQKMEEERKKKEKILDDLFARLNQAEVDREKGQLATMVAQLHKEQDMFLEYLVKVKKERAEQERRIEEIAQEAARVYQEKLEEDRCKVKLHWKDVQRQVLEGRAKQLELKRKKEEEERKEAELRNEVQKQISEKNRQLRVEYERRKCEEVKEYRRDLAKQIEYIKLLKKRENEDLERQLKKVQLEEERYMQLVKDLYSENLKTTECQHPFRRLINKKICSCPSDQTKNSSSIIK